MRGHRLPVTRWQRRTTVGLAAAFIVLALLRIIATYRVFNQTWDEPAHLASGMEWLDRGRYSYEPLHPPLARILVAAGPYLDGLRSVGFDSVWLEGNALLYARHTYQRNLALARLGVLPFLIVAGAVVFAWARRLHGPAGGVLAVALFTVLPPVLAHAGIATTDIAITATCSLALYTGMRWLDHPALARSLAFGAAIGLAVLSKFTALLFVPAGLVAVLLCRRLGSAGKQPEPALNRARRTRGFRVAFLTVITVVWAGYRFSFGPVLPVHAVSAPAPLATPPDPGSVLVHAPVLPAPELFRGLALLLKKNQVGHKAYLLGEVQDTGWWYFFPLALAVKTPLAFLLLVSAGVFASARSPSRPDRWTRLAPAAAAAAILLVCLPGRINIGLRHVLPMYPLLSITAAGGVLGLWRWGRPRLAGRAVVSMLLAWQAVASARIHPDYLAYFNELASAHPERILVDSDLDNGQDLDRLADTLRSRGVPSIALAYAGSATVSEHGLPPIHWLAPHERVTGWVAASLYSLKLGSLDRPGHDDFAWLESYQPVALVGKSIRLYHIPGPAIAPNPAGPPR